MDKQRVAVVGAHGFIGKAVSGLLDKSEITVVKIGSDSAHQLQKSGYWDDLAVDSVVWLASRITPSIAESNPDVVDRELNDFAGFLQACEKTVLKIVFASSGGTAYSGDNAPFREDSEAFGVNAYGRAKISMEAMLSASNIQSVSLRISNAYGPGQRIDRGQGVIASWMHSIVSDNSINVYGSTDAVRDFVYIEDLAVAIKAAVLADNCSSVINIGSGSGTSLSQVIELLRSVTERNFELHLENSRGMDRPKFWLDTSRATNELSWQPMVDLRTGLKTSWDSLTKQGNK